MRFSPTAVGALSVLIGVMLIGGCAQYDYRAVTAGGESREVKKDLDLVIPAAPATLLLRQVESRCVVLIENRGTDEFTLDGAASSIVDPGGQSHRIASTAIPPGAYIKLVLPPLQEAEPRGPRWNVGLGLGVRVDAREQQQESIKDSGAAADATSRNDVNPSLKAVFLSDSTGNTDYWEWTGDGAARLTLVFKQADQTTRHTLTLSREKR